MGNSVEEIIEFTSRIKISKNLKMAFYIYEHPALSIEQFHPGFHHPFQSARVPRYLDMIENLLEQNLMSLGSNQRYCTIKSEKESEQKISNSMAEENKNMDVQVINDDVLVVKAEDDEEKFERKFKLPNNVLSDKIESKFDTKEENVQTLTINIPKDVKKHQIPISMEE